MIRTADFHVTIKRPIKEVWNFWTDFEKVPTWAHNLREVQLITELPVRLGTKCIWKLTFLGKQFEQTLEVTEEKPYTFRTFTVISGPGTTGLMTYRYTFAPTKEGTKVTIHVEGDPAEGFFNVAEPVVWALFKRQLFTSLENLKDLVEDKALVPA